MAWKIVAGSATGIAHTQAGMPCQDAYHSTTSGEWLIAVVCDGAGSARFSATGAQHAAQTLCAELRYHTVIAGGRKPADIQDYWEQRITETVDKTRSSLKSRYVYGDRQFRDYHATVVGVIIGRDYGTFFQIGDGAGAAAVDGDWDNAVFSLPENGAYADETFFFTEEHWREHLRFTPIPTDATLIALMTDGAMSFVMAPQRNGIDRRFIDPVTRYLDSVDAVTGRKALAGTLEDARTHSITTDDKTLLWARRIT